MGNSKVLAAVNAGEGEELILYKTHVMAQLR